MSSRRSGRFTRVTSEGGNHIGANPTEPSGVFGDPVVPPASRGRGQGRGSNAIGVNVTEGGGLYEAPVVPTVGRGRGQRRANVTEPGAYPRPTSYLQLDVDVDKGEVRVGEEGEDEELLQHQLLHHQAMKAPNPTAYGHKVTGKAVQLMWLRGKN